MHLRYKFAPLRSVKLRIIVLLILLGLFVLRFLKTDNETLTSTSLDQSSSDKQILSSKQTDDQCKNRETLSGREKPLYLKENWSRFAKYHDKIRRIEVTLVRNVTNQWDNEHRMRNDGLRLALSTITDQKYLLLTSDADEIPKARFMNTLFHCLLPDTSVRFVLNCDFYYYSYEFRSKKHVYYGSTLTLIRSNQSTLPSGTEIRNQRLNYQFMPSTCYHCTWCFNQLKEVRLKMASYSHTEHNQNQFRTREHILDRYRHGKDLFDRHGEEYIYIHNNTDYPQLVQFQAERFLYMTKRSNLTNVGFIDA